MATSSACVATQQPRDLDDFACHVTALPAATVVVGIKQHCQPEFVLRYFE